MRPIADVAATMGLSFDQLEPYGRDKAKVPLEVFPETANAAPLIVVTAITPTPAGEGKTTTSIGLVDGLARIGKRPVLTIRQPSLGPLFGRKGGGTGGGRATAQPATDINLHFNGDFHAIESAHNFLAAMADHAAHSGDIDGFRGEDITWRRVTDAEDRALRRIVTGVGGRADGPMRETGFDISAASEIMAILALAADYEDLRQRLSDIVVGWTADARPVTAAELRAVGSMMVLLKDALKPNLVQTNEGNPAVVHIGPFGNIAHGCSSIVADRLARACGDYVVTEAGFGADLGFEKFMDIKVRQGGARPSAAVVVATVRGLKWHGGVEMSDMAKENVQAVHDGSANLRHAIGIVQRYGLPAVVAINRFPHDTPDEIAEVQRAALEAGAVAAVEAKGFMEGGEGMTDLAEAVVAAVEGGTANVKLLYEDETPIIKKVEALATKLYMASEVTWGPRTRTTARRFEQNGWDFPICIAKTHLSISANPRLRGAPEGHVFPVTELRVAAGARQVIVLAGDIMTLPGLPGEPNAYDIDLVDGEVTGLLGA
ncbi:MAG: formate--tetrahydrofolate ligase [Chloroflexi bacterium]|nr:formate--tetrahydrofolate ligase [Chloroflexota bacterium]MDA1002679.1 formate--tetrahydrofolate ligase [Chloroflexota bacterium]MQC27580.1 formate--tetrahydrofolate ligase [Chloroflexota bacterium]